MLQRSTVRTVAALVTALCVATTFAGTAAALDLGAVSIDDDGDDAAVEIDTALDTEASQSGGGGSGGVSVQSDEGGAEGSGGVAGDVENQSLSVQAEGEGGPAGDEVGGSLHCELGPDAAEDPAEVCAVEGPGGGDDSPLPIDDVPPEDSPIPPEDVPPEPPGGDEPLPELPGGEVPLPLDGLQSF